MSNSTGCEMHELVDIYVQQSLKNWAAEQRPPVSVKAGLLLQASSRSPLKSLDDRLKNQLERKNKSNLYSFLPYNQMLDGQIIEPFAQSRLWLMCISPSFLRKLA
jgi:hypothetical protein